VQELNYLKWVPNACCYIMASTFNVPMVPGARADYDGVMCF